MYIFKRYIHVCTYKASVYIRTYKWISIYIHSYICKSLYVCIGTPPKMGKWGSLPMNGQVFISTYIYTYHYMDVYIYIHVNV
jgi:hypothetical protein